MAQLFGGQVTHPGIVHAAQVTNAAGMRPLWIHFAPEMMQRQLTRLFHTMALSYWPERGDASQTTINFIIGGASGGNWHLIMSPDGCTAGQGRIKRPTLTMWFRNSDALCRVFTLQMSPLRAILTGQVFGWGDLRLEFRLEHLFSPT